MAVMLDCLGHVFPFISPGTKMDVGQALQPGETPLCAAQNTCPAVSWHLQSLPGQGEAPCLPSSHRLPGPKRSKSRWNLGTSVYWEICHPKLHFLTRNQITSCWHGRKLAINILVWILCARYPQLWALSDEGGEIQHCDTPTSTCLVCFYCTSIWQQSHYWMLWQKNKQINDAHL